MFRFEPIPHGYRVYQEQTLVAVMDTQQQVTDIKQMTPEEAVAHRGPAGAVVWKPMASEHCTIHFTAPQMAVEQLLALARELQGNAAPQPAPDPQTAKAPPPGASPGPGAPGRKG